MSTRKLKTSPLWALALVAALGMGLQACVHDGGDEEEPPATTEPEPPEPTPTDNAMAALETAGTAAQTANTALSAANGALATATDAVTAAAQAFDDATGDAIAAAKTTYDAAVADLTTEKAAQATAAAALGEAITAYEMARSVLSILDPTNAALAPAATAIAALKMAQADTTAVDAADAALAVAANTADPVTTKAAYDAALAAHNTATSAEATEKGKLDAATAALETAKTALEAASGDGLAAAVAAYNTAVANLATAQGAYAAAVADTAAKLTALDAALDAWAKADPDAVGLKNAQAMIAALMKAQDEAAKKAAAELKKVQDDLADAKKELEKIEEAKAEDERKKRAAEDKARNAGYTAALDRAIKSPVNDTDTPNLADNRRLLAIGLDQTNAIAADQNAANLTIKRRNPLTVEVSGWAQAAAAPSLGSGWNGVILTQNRKNAANEDLGLTADSTAYVYTDIEQAESTNTKITELDPDAANAADQLTALQPYIPSALGVDTDFSDNGKVTLNSVHATNTNWWADEEVEITTPGVLPTELNVTKVLPDRFSATVAGMAGTINCPTVGGCTARKTGEGTYVIVGVTDGADATSMAFTPTAGKDATVVVYTDDDTYLTFGWWITTPDDKAASGYRFGSFANSTDGADPAYTLPDAVTGKAEYKGPAAGVYAEKEHGEQKARSGVFIAQASLTANFLGATAGAHVSGKVTNFMSDGESLGNWTVNLGGNNRVNVADNGTITAPPIDPATDTVTAGGAGSGVAASGTGNLNLDGGITTGSFDGLAVDGVWQGQLAGDPTRAGVATSANDAPNNIVGTFDASTHGTSPAGAIQVSGAFGAEKQ